MQDSDKIESKRQAAVGSMVEALARTPPLGLPLWLSALLASLLFVGASLYLLVWMTLGVLVNVIASPLVGLYRWVDSMYITAWYAARLSKRMSEKK
jgi:hypothetical protein